MQLRYVFDFTEMWEHRCTVLAELLDPTEDFDDPISEPTILDGWGWVPDQYGRRRYEDDE